MEYTIMPLVALLPIIMIIMGIQFYKEPPEEITILYGYRTFLSMRNKETWKYANQKWGKYLLTTGLILLIISIAMILVLHITNNMIEAFEYFPSLIVLELIIFGLSLPIVEYKLKSAYPIGYEMDSKCVETDGIESEDIEDV